MSYFKLCISFFLFFTISGCSHTDQRKLASGESLTNKTLLTEDCNEVSLYEHSQKSAKNTSNEADVLNKAYEKFWYKVYHAKSH